MRSEKGVHSPQANKERTLHVHMLVESIYYLFSIYLLLAFCAKMHVAVVLQPLACSKFLISKFPNFQISGLCSYKIVLIKKSVYNK